MPYEVSLRRCKRITGLPFEITLRLRYSRHADPSSMVSTRPGLFFSVSREKPHQARKNWPPRQDKSNTILGALTDGIAVLYRAAGATFSVYRLGRTRPDEHHSSVPVLTLICCLIPRNGNKTPGPEWTLSSADTKAGRQNNSI